MPKEAINYLLTEKGLFTRFFFRIGSIIMESFEDDKWVRSSVNVFYRCGGGSCYGTGIQIEKGGEWFSWSDTYSTIEGFYKDISNKHKSLDVKRLRDLLEKSKESWNELLKFDIPIPIIIYLILIANNHKYYNLRCDTKERYGVGYCFDICTNNTTKCHKCLKIGLENKTFTRDQVTRESFIKNNYDSYMDKKYHYNL